jgi:hypothetical protein
MKVLDLTVGDVVTMRKVHPCGGYRWQVCRVGADIGVRCEECGRRVFMERRLLEKRAKEVTSVLSEACADGLGPMATHRKGGRACPMRHRRSP